jgi:type I restriction enzyme S subunit
VPWATPIDLGRKDGSYITETERTLTDEGLRSGSATVPKGSCLLSTRAPIGYVALVGRSTAFNQGCKGVVPKDRLESRFLLYSLIAARAELISLGQGSTFSELSAAALGSLRVVVPPRVQQMAVANYLDGETAEIDAFIADQEELIALMEERRDSAWQRLYESVDLDSKRRLGQVITSIVDGPFGSSLTSAHYSDSGTRVIRLGNLGINEFRDDDKAFIPDSYAMQLAIHRAVEGDVLIAGLGDDRMPLGRAAMVPDIGPAIVKADVYRVRPRSGVMPAYLAWVLNAPPTRAAMMHLSRGSTRSRLNTSVVREVAVPMPSIDHQSEMLRRHRHDQAPIDAAVADAREAIALFQERRAGLISAAVTGQIDVTERKRVFV